MSTTITNRRLSTIVTRQEKTRVRDAFFALCIAVVAAISVTTLTTATHVASTAHVPQR
jgi:hypothetical protein